MSEERARVRLEWVQMVGRLERVVEMVGRLERVVEAVLKQNSKSYLDPDTIHSPISTPTRTQLKGKTHAE